MTVRQFADGTSSSLPSASRTDVIATGSQYLPPDANVAYADAIASGDVFWMPRTIDGSTWMPSAFVELSGASESEGRKPAR